MFYVSEQESFSAGGITPPVLLPGKKEEEKWTQTQS